MIRIAHAGSPLRSFAIPGWEADGLFKDSFNQVVDSIPVAFGFKWVSKEQNGNPRGDLRGGVDRSDARAVQNVDPRDGNRKSNDNSLMKSFWRFRAVVHTLDGFVSKAVYKSGACGDPKTQI